MISAHALTARPPRLWHRASSGVRSVLWTRAHAGREAMSTAPRDLVAFYEREFPRLVGALDLYVGEHAVAEELAQDALLRACRRWSYVRELDSPGGWVHRVAINLGTSYLRRQAVRRRVERRLTERSELAHHDAPVDVDLRRAVAELPDRQRAAVILHYFLDHRVADVARLIDAPEGTVKADLHHARAKLAWVLGEEVADAR